MQQLESTKYLLGSSVRYEGVGLSRMITTSERERCTIEGKDLVSPNIGGCMEYIIPNQPPSIGSSLGTSYETPIHYTCPSPSETETENF